MATLFRSATPALINLDGCSLWNQPRMRMTSYSRVSGTKFWLYKRCIASLGPDNAAYSLIPLAQQSDGTAALQLPADLAAGDIPRQKHSPLILPSPWRLIAWSICRGQPYQASGRPVQNTDPQFSPGGTYFIYLNKPPPPPPPPHPFPSLPSYPDICSQDICLGYVSELKIYGCLKIRKNLRLREQASG